MGESRRRQIDASAFQVLANSELYDADAMMAQLLAKDRAESEDIASKASRLAEESAADAASKIDRFKQDDKAVTQLQAERAEQKAKTDARNAKLAQEVMEERSQIAIQYEEMALADKFRNQEGARVIVGDQSMQFGGSSNQ